VGIKQHSKMKTWRVSDSCVWSKCICGRFCNRCGVLAWLLVVLMHIN